MAYRRIRACARAPRAGPTRRPIGPGAEFSNLYVASPDATHEDPGRSL